MKKTIAICLLAIQAISCGGPKLISYSPQISSLPQTEENTIGLRCSGLGPDERKAYENAIHNAFSTLLFQGVPESVQSKPMIAPDDANRVKPKVEKCLNDNGCYKNFITQISPGTTTQVKGGNSTMIDIKINIVALRTYLEQDNIIRKFGL